MNNATVNTQEQTLDLDCIAVTWKLLALTNSIQFLSESISKEGSHGGMLAEAGGVATFDSVLLHVMHEMKDLDKAARGIPAEWFEKISLNQLQMLESLERAYSKIQGLLMLFSRFDDDASTPVPDAHIPFISDTMKEILATLQRASGDFCGEVSA